MAGLLSRHFNIQLPVMFSFFVQYIGDDIGGNIPEHTSGSFDAVYFKKPYHHAFHSKSLASVSKEAEFDTISLFDDIIATKKRDPTHGDIVDHEICIDLPVYLSQAHLLDHVSFCLALPLNDHVLLAREYVEVSISFP